LKEGIPPAYCYLILQQNGDPRNPLNDLERFRKEINDVDIIAAKSTNKI